jgi:hypothetical protein
VEFSGPGPTLIVRPDGSAISDWGQGKTLAATVGGVRWTDVIRGRATMHAETQNGSILVSDVSPAGSWTLSDNGVYNNSGPLALEPGPVRYTCSGDSLREFPADGSLELTRKAAAPPAAPGS